MLQNQSVPAKIGLDAEESESHSSLEVLNSVIPDSKFQPLYPTLLEQDTEDPWADGPTIDPRRRNTRFVPSGHLLCDRSDFTVSCARVSEESEEVRKVKIEERLG